MACSKESDNRLDKIATTIAAGLAQNPEYSQSEWIIPEKAVRLAKALIEELDKEMSRPSHLLK